jgi:hypothetical protein
MKFVLFVLAFFAVAVACIAAMPYRFFFLFLFFGSLES